MPSRQERLQQTIAHLQARVGPNLVPTHVHLTKPQARKATKGQIIQLSQSALREQPNIVLHLHPENHKKVKKAHRKRKGVRLGLSHEEIGASGIWDWLKNAGNWIKTNIIDQPLYQSTIKPLARNIVNAGVDAASAFAPAAAPLLKQGADYVGQQTGAFGVRRRKAKKARPTYVIPLGSAENPAAQLAPPGVPQRSSDFHALGGAVGAGRRGGSHLVKGSQAAKDHMARLRAMRKPKGGSFRPA